VYEILPCAKNCEQVGNLKSVFEHSLVERSCGQDQTSLDKSNRNTELSITVGCRSADLRVEAEIAERSQQI
jgi:hypothetical protein